MIIIMTDGCVRIENKKTMFILREGKEKSVYEKNIFLTCIDRRCPSRAILSRLTFFSICRDQRK